MSRTNPRLMRRMAKEMDQLRKEKQSVGIKVIVPENVLSEWHAYIQGPPGTPYDGCVYHITLRVAPEYPFRPPQVMFKTSCWHPNIGVNGHVCLDILTAERWAASLTILKVLQSVQSLLDDADPTSPLNAEAAREWRFGKCHDNWEPYRAHVLQYEKTGRVVDELREFDGEASVAMT
jgi:ubiquitin-conjugating enzyme E2 D/E